MVPGWRVEERFGTAAELHASWPSADLHHEERAVARCHPSHRTIVLGSTQPDSVVDRTGAARAGASVVRRRTGGGAVLVGPSDPAWIDVWVPTGDPLWDADVSRAFGWLGAVWRSALGSLGVEGLSVQGVASGIRTEWSALVCFGGVGTGEVTVTGGRKVVGLAQRRTRTGAWIQGACAIHWDPSTLLGALALPPEVRRAAVGGLEGAAVGVADLDWTGRPVPDADAVTASFLAHLP